jgi:hypothetical protein
LLLSAALWVVLYPRSAAALADLSGRWHVEIDIPVDFNSQTWEVSQTGTDLSVVMSAGGIVQTWTGTIDTGSGAFTLIAPTADPGCPPSEIDAVVNPSSTSFSGVFRLRVNVTGCEEGMFSVEGRRCGNGVLDAGEQCEDGNFDDGDCCSSTCQLDGAGTSCAAANSCTNDTCDGAGHCQIGGPADGRPCDDNLFCNGFDSCQGGTCGAHAGDPCSGMGDCRACNEIMHECRTPAGFPQGCPDDGNECTAEVCDASMVCQHVPGPGQPCTADANPCTLDQCDAAGACAHLPAPSYYFCPDDGKACTYDMCDGAGACAHTLVPAGYGCTNSSGGACGRTCDGVSDECPTTGLTPAGSFDARCAQCEVCDGAGACVAAPISVPQCKRPTMAGAARLLVKKNADDTRRRLVWRWATGEVTALEDFGTPEIDDDYTLCVYEAVSSATPNNAIQATLFAGDSSCFEPPCWQRSQKALRYRSRLGVNSGFTTVLLKSGSQGHAMIRMVARGPIVPLAAPGTPFEVPLLAQLRNDDGKCWEASYGSADLNDGEKLRARSD